MLSPHDGPRTAPAFLIESDAPATGLRWPGAARQALLHDRELAVVTAAKMRGAAGCEVRVVHVPTGEVVYRKRAGD